MKKTKIMLVEDSKNLRLVLKDYFEMMGCDVIDFEDGESAMKAYYTGCCDICLLDIGLPKKDGYIVINELHEITPGLPVVFVTARDSKDDKIKGFKAGCDDYITKPFSTGELLLRMEAILKRCGSSCKKERSRKDVIFHLGDFIFNFSELKLIYKDRVRMLTRKEAKLLKFLYEYKNKLIPREIITKEIWGDSKAASGRSLDVFLSKIRRYLIVDVLDINGAQNFNGERKHNIEGDRPKVEIVNIHGAGYLLRVRD
jgi:DNA-binding response OmpR family regulator